MAKRKFVCYFFYVGWWLWSIGISLDFHSPNIEIHLPCGFIRIGWMRSKHYSIEQVTTGVEKREFGIK